MSIGGLHPLLRRQLKKLNISADDQFDILGRILDVVSQSYHSFDEDRCRLERAMDISSEELTVARDKAEEGSRVKTRFLANMSHEIRTPMNGVLGMTELLLDSGLSPEQRDLAQTIRECATSLLGIINDVLDFAKIEAGKLEIACEPFDLVECIERCHRLFSSRLLKGKLSFITEIHPSVPRHVRGDPARLTQVLINLIGNAIKFTNADGVIMVIVEPADARAGRVNLRFHVCDTGIGIALDDQKHIFNAFSQATQIDMRKYGGTGLGLAIVTQLVQLMGGEIALTSISGKGTRFSFNIVVLPVTEKFEPELEATRADSQDMSTSVRPLKILAAEDNAVNQKLIIRFLERRGHSVVLAENGKRAVEELEAHHFDVILMDVQMPEMDGPTATALIRALPDPQKANVPIIALTANALVGDRETLLAKGMTDYVAKPFTSKILDAALARVLPQQESD